MTRREIIEIQGDKQKSRTTLILLILRSYFYNQTPVSRIQSFPGLRWHLAPKKFELTTKCKFSSLSLAIREKKISTTKKLFQDFHHLFQKWVNIFRKIPWRFKSLPDFIACLILIANIQLPISVYDTLSFEQINTRLQATKSLTQRQRYRSIFTWLILTRSKTRRPASTGIFFAQLQIFWSTFANG